MKGKPNTHLSLLFISLVILCLIIINTKIAHVYQFSSGKTRALFGLIELFSFSYKYYFLLPAFAAIIFAVIGRKKNEEKNISITAIVLSVLSAVLVYIPFWKLFI